MMADRKGDYDLGNERSACPVCDELTSFSFQRVFLHLWVLPASYMGSNWFSSLTSSACVQVLLPVITTYMGNPVLYPMIRSNYIRGGG